MADGELAPDEINVIKKIASMVMVTDTEVEDIIAIYKAEQSIKAARIQLTYPNGSPY
jgi:uncharacterized tellurite resistance protein B-like protein